MPQSRTLSDRELLITNKKIFFRVPKIINSNELERIKDYLFHYKLLLFENDIIERMYFGLEIMQDRGCWIREDWSNYAGIKFLSKTMGAHRLSYLIFNGKLDSILNICHYCDRPGCRNPFHLFEGTNSDNKKDSELKGRAYIVKAKTKRSLITKELREKDRWRQLKRFCK